MYLNDEQKRQIIEQRLTQFAAEKYQHELNLTLAQSMNDATAIQTATDAIAIIDQAISVHEAELSNLG